MVKGYEGDTLWFNITEDESEDKFKKDRPPKEGEYSRYKSASVTQRYDNTSSSSTTSEISQGNEYNIEERMSLIEKKALLKTLLQNRRFIIKVRYCRWDSIIPKGVRTKYMLPVGNVTAVTNTTIVITSGGDINEDNVLKEKVEAFNEAEVTLNATYDRFEQFRVKMAR